MAEKYTEAWIRSAPPAMKALIVARFRQSVDDNMRLHHPTGASLSALHLFELMGFGPEEFTPWIDGLVTKYDWPFAILIREEGELQGPDDKTGVLFMFPEGWSDGRKDRVKYQILSGWGLSDEVD